MEIRDSAVARTIGFEAMVGHFYLDTLGKVTIGVGQMIPDADTAAALNLTIDNRAATSAEKKQCWTVIKGKTPGQPASSYENFTKCRMSRAEAELLLKERLKLAASDLKGRFPQLDTYPEDAQDALLDMMFNIGKTNFSAAKWPRLFAAVLDKEWSAAAAASNRPQVPASRNAEIKRLFEAAAPAPLFNVEEIASTLDRLMRERLSDVRTLVTGDSTRFFPGGITKVVVKLELAGSRLDLEVSGPDPGAASLGDQAQ